MKRYFQRVLIRMIKKTKRLILRSLEITDYMAWKQAHLETLPKQTPWDVTIEDRTKLSKANFKKLIRINKKNEKNGSYYHFAIFKKRSGAIVGFISLMDISRNIFQNAYLGYYIFNNHWENGYAKEAGNAIIKIAFKDLNLHRIEAAINPNNKPSIALAKSIGLKKEYLSQKRLFTNGQWNDFLIFAATSEDFGIKWKKK